MSITPATIHDDFRVPLDMDQVSREALFTRPRSFDLTFDCFGKEFKCRVDDGKSIEAATIIASNRLAGTFPEFSRYEARVTACIEVNS